MAVELRVQEALQNDIGRGIARLDSTTRKKLDVSAGDIIEIAAKRGTPAIVWQAYPEDEGKNFIRIDGLIRQNCGAAPGDKVKVSKPKIVCEAQKITFAPVQAVRFSEGFADYTKKRLLGRPIVKGDSILLGVFGQPLIFKVVQVQPKEIVQITDVTKIVIREEPVKELEGVPTITYEDIGGLGVQVKKVREIIELPLRHPELFTKLGIEPPKGVLLFGPPGTGKTLLAKAVANESDANFTSIQGPEIVSKFVGEAEQRLRQIFEDAEKNAPSIIFIDELDAIAPKREEVVGEVEKRIVAQLLALMDGLKGRGKVIVIGATNRPNALDPALRRPGRFDREIELPVPDKQGRKEILQIHTRSMPLTEDVVLDEFINITHGYVGADLAALAREAAMKTLRRVLPKIDLEDESIPVEILESLKVTRRDFLDAFKEVQPSAMREVLIENPNVHWADIGGLEKAKAELKEAIEWPLKFPEMFKRMGIKPPRGIFIFGPPGTGKTLLAKAVATESEANFISIKGPELLCVSGDTPIITNLCGLQPISEVYGRIASDGKILGSGRITVFAPHKKVLLPALDSSYNQTFAEMKNISKLFVEDTYNILLKNGTDLSVSANQPFLVFRDGFIWIKADELKKGDFIALPSFIPTFNKKIPLPLLKYGPLRIVSEDKNSFTVRIFSAKETIRLPKHLTPALSEFLGWFAAEGNVSKQTVMICNHNRKNRERIASLFTQFASENRIKTNKAGVLIYSSILEKFLEQIFEMPSLRAKSKTIRVPPILFKASEEAISRFLRGAWSGDGTTTKTKIEYGSLSEELSRGISYLLTYLSIRHRFWRRKDGMSMITISGKKDMKMFLNKVFRKKLSTSVRQYYNARYILPPISSLLRKLKKDACLVYGKDIPEGLFEAIVSGRKRCGLLRLRRIVNFLDKVLDDVTEESSAEYSTLKKLAVGNLSWTTVLKKACSKPMWMYDIETSEGSFMGGPLPAILHNSKWVGESEHGIRETFRKARQAAPCIIFFDEIDALAPRRGGEFGTHVIENVVNQLLTEMDGLEELKEVIVIGATNRPDLVDPALLRPGRFDRLVQIPAPDQDTRFEIFKVHTKKVPLAKDIDLKKLAEMTEGYSGADIEAVVREAAMAALRESKQSKQVSWLHFEKALKTVQPSLADRMIKYYDKFKKEYSGAEFV